MADKTETYKFSHNGRNYEVPSLKAIPTGVIRKTRKITDDTDKSFTILELVLGEDSPELAVIDSMTPQDFTDWLTGWTGGAPLGEASDS
tara:strand:- start:2758 stop:3024 length:267 start_codon:yes stop_codon:yes gene_type:complete